MNVTSDSNGQVEFQNEVFQKSSGLYFTKDGAEFKKAVINILKKSTGQPEGAADEVLATTDINLSSLISKEMIDHRIEFG